MRCNDPHRAWRQAICFEGQLSISQSEDHEGFGLLFHVRADLGESSIHGSHGQVVAAPVHKALVGSRSLLLLLPAMHTATAQQHAHTLPQGASTLSNLGLSNKVSSQRYQSQTCFAGLLILSAEECTGGCLCYLRFLSAIEAAYANLLFSSAEECAGGIAWSPGAAEDGISGGHGDDRQGFMGTPCASCGHQHLAQGRFQGQASQAGTQRPGQAAVFGERAQSIQLLQGPATAPRNPQYKRKSVGFRV